MRLRMRLGVTSTRSDIVHYVKGGLHSYDKKGEITNTVHHVFRANVLPCPTHLNLHQQ